MLREVIGARSGAFIELDAREPLPSLSGFQAVVITGSAASVTSRAPWISEAEASLVRAVEEGVFIFGVCFGHQLLGQALGGSVARNPAGREIGTVGIEVVASDPLLDGQSSFSANMTHVDSVVTLPPGATLVGRSRLDSNAIVRFAERVWGVQFHPEIDASIMLDYLEARSAVLREEGLDPDALRQTVADAPIARAVLGRFIDLAFTP